MICRGSKDTLMEIFHHVSELGWEGSCWSEESLSTKKMYPGYMFASKSKSWGTRLRTTDSSMALAVRRLQNQHKKSPLYSRRKVDLAKVDQYSERAALVENLAKELLQRIPVDQQLVDAEWRDAWATGSDIVDIEVQALLIEKKEDFDITIHVPAFRKIIDQHHQKAPISVQAPSSDQQEAIDIDTLHLFEQQTKYDIQAYGNWVKKCSNVFASRHHAVQEFALQKRQKCEAAGSNYMEACMKFCSWQDGRIENLISEVMDFRRHIQEKLAIKTPGEILYLVYWNQTVPSLVTADVFEKAGAMLSWALNDNMQSCGAVLLPTHTYKVGHLHLEEERLMSNLKQGNHNIDNTFCIPFKDIVDSRDRRPALYMGRFVFSSPLGEPRSTHFGKSELFKKRRVEESQQLAPRNMREVEDLNPGALPSSADTRDGLRGAAKYAQIGSAACQNLLTSLLTGGPGHLGETKAVVIMDLFSHVGEMAESFPAVRSNFNVNLFYIGFSVDQTEKMWTESLIQDQLVEKYLVDMQLPGGEKLADCIPEALVEPLPAAPKLNVLTMTGEEGDMKKLAVHSTIVHQWTNHSNSAISKKFIDWLDLFIEDGFVVFDPADITDKKRKSAEPNPSPKKPKTNLTILVPEEIKETLLFEIKLAGVPKDAALLQVRQGNQIYLFNKSSSELTLPEGSFLCAFGKGSFKEIKPDAADNGANPPVLKLTKVAKPHVVSTF